MKAVLVGSDLLYRRDGSLAPIEINTNVGWDEGGRVEPVSEVFNLEDIKTFVEAHNIKKIYLEGVVVKAFKDFLTAFPDLTVETVTKDKYNEKADEADTLAIRTFYSDEALVDSFCRDKINFLKSIQDTELAVEFLLKTSEGFEGFITDLNLHEDGMPNFILKYRYPQYSHKEYPAFYRFESLEALMNFANSENMPEDFFLMPFYYNPDKLYKNERIQMVRNWSVYVANDEGSLDSLYLGKYTKLCGKIDTSKLVWNEDGSLVEGRDMLVDSIWTKNSSGDMMVEKDDLVWMADGSWKVASELEEGDEVLSIDIPVGEDVDVTKHSEVDYNISLEEFKEITTFRTNRVTDITPVVGFTDTIRMIFSDGTDWFDSANSSYPILDPEDGTVMFRELRKLEVGDKVILAGLESTETEGEQPNYIVQEIVGLETERVEIEGYNISTDGSHLVLTRTSEDAGAYISIEHNKPSSNYCYTDDISYDGGWTYATGPCGSGYGTTDHYFINTTAECQNVCEKKFTYVQVSSGCRTTAQGGCCIEFAGESTYKITSPAGVGGPVTIYACDQSPA